MRLLDEETRLNPAEQRTLLDTVQHPDGVEAKFDSRLTQSEMGRLEATGIGVFQINVGKLCNQTCIHCHVDAGPLRSEVMTRETAELCMQVLASTEIPTVDITGGAPEMCPSFEYLVRESRGLGRHVIDRCNLTILTVPRYSHLPDFLAEQGVELICSLPHYRDLATDRQRGEGVFERSIQGLKLLNERGYGQAGSGLRLVLVTNPTGAFLPSTEGSVEAEWKEVLEREFGIVFDSLYTITNMPISRYLEWLQRSGNLDSYMRELVRAFNPAAVGQLMCRTTLSVGWDGQLHDCDFNQMLELPLAFGVPQHLDEFDLQSLTNRRIVTGTHCFGCTAGAGSSCGGKIT
jgi:radical SAM/Cys-rich protein